MPVISPDLSLLRARAYLVEIHKSHHVSTLDTYLKR